MLTHLRLIQLRCHERLDVGGFGGVNFFLGSNGQGKSTLLEAIYLLARCRSYRTVHAKEMNQWGESGFSVRGDFSGEPFHSLSFTWQEGQRVLGVDAIERASLQEYWGLCTAVIFKNRDLALVQDRAQNRRHWIDGLIASAEPQYLPVVQRFQRVLKQRNALLHENSPDRKIWEALTDQFWALAEKITSEREKYSGAIQEGASSVLKRLSPGEHEFSFIYQPDFRRHAQISRDQLFEKEKRFAATQLGPHRDDWDLKLNQKPLREFGSEGQQRSAALALRFAEVSILEKIRGKTPILLLDDILHELDESRRGHFWDLLPATAQIFFATTQADSLPSSLDARKWEIGHSSAKLLT